MTKKPKPRKKVSMAEMKRQVRALKDELEAKNQLIAELPPAPVESLGDRWENALGIPEPGHPTHYLDGDEENNSGTIAELPQGEDGTLYQITVGPKVAYFDNKQDAAVQGERWVDGHSRSRDAINTPHELRRNFETEEQQVGQDNPRDMKSTGPASESLDDPYIESVDRPISDDKMAMLAFMEEEILVMVHDTTNEQDVPIPCFQNDGVTQYFIRGKEQTVKRKFIEVLARCKKTVFSQEAYKDASGADAFRQIPHTALMYPFAVRHDPNPRGGAWLTSVLQEG